MSSTATEPRTSPLTADEIVEFYERGFLRPGRVLTDEQLERLRSGLERSREREAAAGREYDLLDPALWPDQKKPAEPGKSVGFMFDLWREDEDFREVAFNSTLARWASQLIGARQVRLLEDGAIYKEPGTGGALNWHQDYAYWPLATPTQVTAWIALDRVTEENGGMHMAVGSHHLGERLPASFGSGETYLEDRRPSTVRAVEDPVKLGLEIAKVELEAGEVSFHHPYTWHASGPNTTDRPRRGFVPRYCADGAIWLGSRRYDYNFTDEEVGIEIGEPLGGQYFPLVPF
jgi:ectoine hydroxylase-related dioxygenase (phytanoyl-CoA dioxygenase family)